MHPLHDIWLAAAAGRFPAVDGGYTFVPPFARGLEGVVSFTGHAFLATDLDEASFAGLELDGFGAALQPPVLQRMAGPRGVVGVQDATLVAFGRGNGRALIAEALALAPPGEPVFAAVSPGNARSLRAFLAAGFTLLGGETWVKPGRADVVDR